METVRSGQTGYILKVESTGLAVVVSKNEESRMASRTEQWKAGAATD